MTIQQAEQIIRDYQELLADESKRGSRREPNLLPASKDQVMNAIKLELAQLYFLNSHTNGDHIRTLTKGAMFLDSFSELPIEPGEFIEAMHQRRREVDHFYVELIRLDRSAPFYWQRIYTMLGINSETKTTSFFEGIKQRLGFKQAPGDAAESVGVGEAGRLTLD